MNWKKTIYTTLITVAVLLIINPQPVCSQSNDFLVRAYRDSLVIYKQKVDSLKSVNDSLSKELGYPADNKYFRFFAPLAYYPDVTSSLLGC